MTTKTFESVVLTMDVYFYFDLFLIVLPSSSCSSSTFSCLCVKTAIDSAIQIQILVVLHLVADPIWTFVIVYRNVLLQQRKTGVHADVHPYRCTRRKGELISVFGMLLVIVVGTQIQKNSTPSSRG